MNQMTRRQMTQRAMYWAAAVLGALQTASLTARAELLIEEKNQPAALTSADSTVEAQAPAPRVAPQIYPIQPVVIAAPQMAPQMPQVAQAAAVDPLEKMTRTDLVRRERMREELRNEDILQERLEELRLQDEKRRTDQVFGGQKEAAAPVAAAPAVTEQVVSIPVTERPGSAAAVAVVTPGSTSIIAAIEQPAQEVTTLRLSPRFGMPGFQGESTYNLQGRYAVGVGLDVGVSDHLGFEMGYNYGEYGVALNSATALGLGPVVGNWGWNYNANNTTGILKQNVIDAGIKLHMLGRGAKLRPFIGAGAGYARSYLNYDQRIVTYMRQMGFGASPDYDLTQFLANASAGIELQLSKSVMVGLTYKYFTVLSSRQNTELFNPALYGAFPTGGFYTPYGGYGYPGVVSYGELDKQLVGGTLANTNFYSVMGTVSFVF